MINRNNTSTLTKIKMLDILFAHTNIRHVDPVHVSCRGVNGSNSVSFSTNHRKMMREKMKKIQFKMKIENCSKWIVKIGSWYFRDGRRKVFIREWHTIDGPNCLPSAHINAKLLSPICAFLFGFVLCIFFQSEIKVNKMLMLVLNFNVMFSTRTPGPPTDLSRWDAISSRKRSLFCHYGFLLQNADPKKRIGFFANSARRAMRESSQP